MAASAAVAVGHHTIQVLSIETGPGRRIATRQGNSSSSMLSSSFLGESFISVSGQGQCHGHGHTSRPFLPALLCVRMESRINGDEAFPAWQRSAVAFADYPVIQSEVEKAGFRRGPGDNGFGNADDAISVASSDSKGLDITTIGLKQEFVDALLKRGITNLFPIQEAVMKPATEGADIIARARTGTGKTLAFGIPIIQSLLEQNEQNSRRYRNPRVLVLAPTRELAMQVEKEFMESAPNLSTICVYGGVSIMSQQRKLQRGVDIAVGTPGRVIDLIERGSLALHEVRYLVLDEADQMLAVGFEEEVERILENVPTERQTMLFSATMPSWVNQLARKYLKSPLKIDLVGDSDEKLAEGIKIFSITVPASAKRSVLSDLITVYGKGGKTIVFTQRKVDADEVALSMSRMLGTEALHGDISQAQREKTLAAFRDGRFSVLVATDVAARGLDIPNVDLVIHFEIPNDPETFVHRSGRTGRAGKEGITILMHTDSQRRTARMIEKDVGCKFQPIGAPTADDVLKASAEQARYALSKVHPDLKSVFLPTAEMLLQEQGAEALAAAIAHLSGFTQPPASRSLITHEQGWMTLLFTRNQRWGSGGGISSPRGVMGALGSIYPKAADEVGKILILDPSEGMGAVFDLPEDVAKELLSAQLPPEDSIQPISKLPRLQNDEPPRDRYGRFSSRGGRMDGAPMGGRGRQQYGRSTWSNSQSGWSRRDNQQSGSWSSGQRYQGGNGGYQRQVQTCFICGEPGHRAAVCPQR